MKKTMYIQPTIEVVKMQQTQAICGFSPVVGGETPDGGTTSDDPFSL